MDNLPNATTTEYFKEQGVLPPELTGEIFKQVGYNSTVLSVAGTIPVSIAGGVTFAPAGDTVAGVVDEGGLKPIVGGGLKVKAFKPIKVAALMYWSQEARMANPGGYTDTFVQRLTDGVTKAVDMAVIHGKNALTDEVIPGQEYLAQSPNVVELGTSALTAGGLSADIISGYDAVTNAGFDFDSFVADPRMRTKFMSATDTTGRPIYSGSVDLSGGTGDILGLPVTYGRAVSGKVGAVADTGIRAIGGAFKDNLKLGFVENITYRRTTEATLEDGGQLIPLFQRNLEAFIVEATFGWVINDVNAFAVYTDKVA